MKPEPIRYLSGAGACAELARLYQLPTVRRVGGLGSRLVCDVTFHHYIGFDGRIRRKISKCPGRACPARKVKLTTTHNPVLVMPAGGE